jgi:hypothetical protein
VRGEIGSAQHALQHTLVIDHHQPPDAEVSELLHESEAGPGCVTSREGIGATGPGSRFFLLRDGE